MNRAICHALMCRMFSSARSCQTAFQTAAVVTSGAVGVSVSPFTMCPQSIRASYLLHGLLCLTYLNQLTNFSFGIEQPWAAVECAHQIHSAPVVPHWPEKHYLLSHLAVTPSAARS